MVKYIRTLRRVKSKFDFFSLGVKLRYSPATRCEAENRRARAITHSCGRLVIEVDARRQRDARRVEAE
jgi:hypothetical protein